MFNYLYMYSKKILDTFLRQNTQKSLWFSKKTLSLIRFSYHKGIIDNFVS